MKKFLVFLTVLFLGTSYAHAVSHHCADSTPANPINPCGTEDVCRRDYVVRCEDWEDGDHEKWAWNSGWDPAGDPPNQYKIINAGGANNTANSLRMRIPPRTSSTSGSDDTVYPNTDGYMNLPRNTTIYARWYAKWSPGYQYMEGYGDGQKHAYFTQYGTTNTTVRVMIQAPDGERYHGRIVNSIDSHGNTRYYNGTSEQFVVPDRWYCIETKVVPSSTNTATDGAITIWLNDAVYMNYSNLLTTSCTGGSCPWTQLMLTSYYGGNPGPTHPEQFVSYDNIVIATQRIGCIGAGTDTTAPGRPLNLSIQ